MRNLSELTEKLLEVQAAYIALSATPIPNGHAELLRHFSALGKNIGQLEMLQWFLAGGSRLDSDPLGRAIDAVRKVV